MAAIVAALRAAFATEARKCVSGGILVLAAGVLLGMLVPGDSNLPDWWRSISSVIGWTYFAAWTVSFWPQIVSNAIRRSVVGLSFDYVALNLLGFSAYTAYNAALFSNAVVRAQYADVNNGSTPGVAINDLFFAGHAVFATLLIILQIAIYERGGQRVSLTASLMVAAMVVGIVVYTIVVATGAGGSTWLNLVNYLSYNKLAVSLTKYIPQTVLNYRRKSTVGWTIYNVLLDFAGGLLSVVQLVGDAITRNDWSVVTGDPVKFGLGFASMFFDVIFMVQHYCLYPEGGEAGAGAYQRVAGDAESGSAGFGGSLGRGLPSRQYEALVADVKPALAGAGR